MKLPLYTITINEQKRKEFETISLSSNGISSVILKSDRFLPSGFSTNIVLVILRYLYEQEFPNRIHLSKYAILKETGTGTDGRAYKRLKNVMESLNALRVVRSGCEIRPFYIYDGLICFSDEFLRDVEEGIWVAPHFVEMIRHRQFLARLIYLSTLRLRAFNIWKMDWAHFQKMCGTSKDKYLRGILNNCLGTHILWGYQIKGGQIQIDIPDTSLQEVQEILVKVKSMKNLFDSDRLKIKTAITGREIIDLYRRLRQKRTDAAIDEHVELSLPEMIDYVNKNENWDGDKHFYLSQLPPWDSQSRFERTQSKDIRNNGFSDDDQEFFKQFLEILYNDGYKRKSKLDDYEMVFEDGINKKSDNALSTGIPPWWCVLSWFRYLIADHLLNEACEMRICDADYIFDRKIQSWRDPGALIGHESFTSRMLETLINDILSRRLNPDDYRQEIHNLTQARSVELSRLARNIFCNKVKVLF